MCVVMAALSLAAPVVNLWGIAFQGGKESSRTQSLRMVKGS